MILDFALVFVDYFLKIVPALLVGFFISGVVNEFVSINWVEKHLGKNSIKSILLSTFIGIFLPICCFGSLPVAVSLHKKGASLGAILGFLIATPATSITALIVCYILLGWKFTIFIFSAVIITGLIVGIGGNSFTYKRREQTMTAGPGCCEQENGWGGGKGTGNRIVSIFKFAFIRMPKDIGLELLLGLVLAAVVGAVVPVGNIVESYLGGGFGFLFSLIFGLVMYFCSTASVPLVDAFISQGMNVGAGMVLLLVGPITSYGTILVLRKEFGWRILLYYLGLLSILSLIFGYLYYLIF